MHTRASLVVSLDPGFLINYVIFTPCASSHELNEVEVFIGSVRVEMLANQVHGLLAASAAWGLLSMHNMVLVNWAVNLSILRFLSEFVVRDQESVTRLLNRLIESLTVLRTSFRDRSRCWRLCPAFPSIRT